MDATQRIGLPAIKSNWFKIVRIEGISWLNHWLEFMNVFMLYPYVWLLWNHHQIKLIQSNIFRWVNSRGSRFLWNLLISFRFLFIGKLFFLESFPFLLCFLFPEIVKGPLDNVRVLNGICWSCLTHKWLRVDSVTLDFSTVFSHIFLSIIRKLRVVRRLIIIATSKLVDYNKQ